MNQGVGVDEFDGIGGRGTARGGVRTTDRSGGCAKELRSEAFARGFGKMRLRGGENV
jgi:hypothetical protein